MQFCLNLSLCVLLQFYLNLSLCILLQFCLNLSLCVLLQFYLILNVAVGGRGFFPDSNTNRPHPKPWQDDAGHEADRFWAARAQWYPTWHPDHNHGEDAALKVNYVKVWKTKPDP